MKLSKEEFDRIVPTTGIVICEIPGIYHKRLSASSEMFESVLVAQQSKADMSVRSGVVWRVSANSDVPWRNEMFDSEMEVEPGVKVWWSMNAGQQSILDSENRIYYVEDKVYISLPYKELVMKLQRGRYVGLNDYVIAQPVEDHKGILANVRPYSGKLHNVVAVPTKTATYRNMHRVLNEERVDVEPGETVVTYRETLNFMESEHNMELPGRWVCFQSRLITAKVHEQ